jgi:hypothetical protein
VEGDETFVGGVEPGGGKRHVGKKALGVVAAELRGAIGRIRLRRVADSSADRLLPFAQEAVAPGAVVITTAGRATGGAPRLAYRHDRRVVLGSGESPEALLPTVHRVASL